jgi:hypothetical protein
VGDLIYANAISAAKILPKLVGPRALRELMKRGLVDRDEEDGHNVLEERAIRYAAACSVRLAQGVETALSKVSVVGLQIKKGSSLMDFCRSRIWRRRLSSWNPR